jgi:hypothetical protein
MLIIDREKHCPKKKKETLFGRCIPDKQQWSDPRTMKNPFNKVMFSSLCVKCKKYI